MKKLLSIMRPPASAGGRLRAAHHIWMALALTGLGCCIGGLSLLLSASAYVQLNGWAICYSYLTIPLILVLNMLPPVLLIWLFYFLSRRSWVGFLGGFLPTIGLSLVNYYKIRLRGDPFLATDLRLAAEAKGFVSRYTLDLTPIVLLSLVCFAAGLLFCIFLLPQGMRGRRERVFGAASCLALMAVAFLSLYCSPRLYQKIANERFINKWSAVEVFVSKGSVYSFLHSIPDMFPVPPEGYDREQAAALLARYPDSDIPNKVTVMGVMLEAFCDLTDFDSLASRPEVAELYVPWHELEEQSVSGDLLTNIFAGGTVDTEWAFLTGYSSHDEFRAPVDSYVRYFSAQGYQVFGAHPGYGWVYNRQNVNQYLGFDEYWFTDNYFGVDPDAAMLDSDPMLAEDVLSTLTERVEDGPCFSFNVTIQNHGPYSLGAPHRGEYVTPANTGMPEESCNILNNYLGGVNSTIQSMVGLVQGLEELDEPVVLVLFGDHKPWLGNGDSVYIDLDVHFDISTRQGFTNYYATPYLIWANSAAKEALGRDFTGEGGDFSPCFLMQEVFNQCGWEGPGFMKLSREMRELTPMLHEKELFWLDGAPADTLEGDTMDFYQRFRCAQYYRETEGLSGT